MTGQVAISARAGMARVATTPRRFPGMWRMAYT
jgi:hypothetical protein